MLIYKATIPAINKSYIGLIHKSGKTMQDRAHDHYLRSQKIRKKRLANIKIKHNEQNKFLNAILFYGFDNVKWQIIEDNIQDFDYLLQRQIYYIRLFNTFKDGLNSTIGGEGCKGMKQSQHRKQVARQLRLGKKQSEQTRKRKSEAQKDRKHSAQTIAKLIQIRRKRLTQQRRKQLQQGYVKPKLTHQQHIKRLHEGCKKYHNSQWGKKQTSKRSSQWWANRTQQQMQQFSKYTRLKIKEGKFGFKDKKHKQQSKIKIGLSSLNREVIQQTKDKISVAKKDKKLTQNHKNSLIQAWKKRRQKYENNQQYMQKRNKNVSQGVKAWWNKRKRQKNINNIQDNNLN